MCLHVPARHPQALDPELWHHLRHRLGVRPAALALPWITTAFAGALPLQEVRLGGTGGIEWPILYVPSDTPTFAHGGTCPLRLVLCRSKSGPLLCH